MNLAAIAGALLDLLAVWGQGVLFGFGVAIGVGAIVYFVREWGAA